MIARLQHRYTWLELPLFIMPAVLFIALLSWPWPTLPGEGLNLTLNLLTWLWCTLWGLSLAPALLRRHVRGGPLLALLAAGILLMGLPWLWTPQPFKVAALYRLAGLVTLALMLATLLQVPIGSNHRRRLYAIVVIAGLIQALVACVQLLWPQSAAAIWTGYNFLHWGGRPTGLLWQANILGSFLATALACALWLALTRRHRAALVATFLLSAAVWVTGSRTAILAIFLVTAGLLWLIPAKRTHRAVAGILFFVGLLAGQGILTLRPATLPHAAGDTRPTTMVERQQNDRKHSDSERVTMLRGGLHLIEQSPFAGNGLATFERRFPEALADIGVRNPLPLTVSHPHNELLYVWSEGGIAALAGLLLWLGIWARPFLRRQRTLAARGMLTLPLLVHCMTEMPLYLSAAHGVLLILLLRTALPAARGRHFGTRRYAMAATLVTICFAGSLFLVTGLRSAFTLQDAERFQLLDPAPLSKSSNPYAQPDRLLFDRAVSDLMLFNLTQDPALTARFKQQASLWLVRHNDANLTATMMQLAHRRHDIQQEQAWRYRGCLSFQQDPRFHCLP